MNNCQHPYVVGDNYGRTCGVCGAVLAGYGYWAEGGKTCLHHYLPDGNGNRVCSYCEDFIPGDEKRAEEREQQ